MERGNPCTEYRSRGLHIDRFGQMYAVWLVNNGVLRKEAISCETLKQLLATMTVQIMNHAPFALKAAPYDVQEANPVAFLVALVLDGRMHLLNVACAFVAQRRCLASFYGHDIRVA